jgi:hypothetical protein
MNKDQNLNKDIKKCCDLEKCDHPKYEGESYKGYNYSDSTGRKETDEHYRNLQHPEKNWDKHEFIPGNRGGNILDKEKDKQQLGFNKNVCLDKCSEGNHDKECQNFI